MKASDFEQYILHNEKISILHTEQIAMINIEKDMNENK